MQKIYRIKTSPCARQENMIIGNQYRITVLTEGLVRLEYNADGEFEDRATQMVLYRDFPEVDYRVIHTENGIEINTSRLHLVYDEKEFSSASTYFFFLLIITTAPTAATAATRSTAHMITLALSPVCTL